MSYAQKLWGAFVAVLALAQIGAEVRAQERSEYLVFAAASLSNVLVDIGQEYESQSGNKIVFSFAGSMTLARQIELSSGVDIFISADLESMDYLASRGLIMPSTRRNLFQNELVLVAPADSSVQAMIGPGFDLSKLLGTGRLAVANVVSVPAGRYARSALEMLGAWDSVSNALAEGEDVRTTLALVARGETPLGIVYATDAEVEPRVRVVARFPASSHSPILYPAALTVEAREGADAFLNYLQGTEAQSLFESAGFITF